MDLKEIKSVIGPGGANGVPNYSAFGERPILDDRTSSSSSSSENEHFKDGQRINESKLSNDDPLTLSIGELSEIAKDFKI